MRMMYAILLLVPMMNYAEEEIAFEENDQVEECAEPSCHSHRPPRYYFNPEEEKMIEDRTEAHWPAKRDDSLYEKLSHY